MCFRLSDIVYSFVFHENPKIRTIPIYTQILSVITFSESNYLKLVRIVFMQEGDRHTHQSGKVTRDVLSLIDIDAITIVILGVDRLVAIINLSKFDILMTLIKFQVCKPKTTICGNNLLAFAINTYFRSVLIIIVWHNEPRNATTKINSKPCFAFLDQTEYFLIRDSINISNNKELLIISHNLRYELPK